MFYSIYKINYNDTPVYIGYTTKPLEYTLKRYLLNAKKTPGIKLFDFLRSADIRKLSIEELFTTKYKEEVAYIVNKFIMDYDTINNGCNTRKNITCHVDAASKLKQRKTLLALYDKIPGELLTKRALKSWNTRLARGPITLTDPATRYKSVIKLSDLLKLKPDLAPEIYAKTNPGVPVAVFKHDVLYACFKNLSICSSTLHLTIGNVSQAITGKRKHSIVKGYDIKYIDRNS